MTAAEPPTILYLTPGVFDKGGIARYGRYQIAALRRIVGTGQVTVFAVHGHRPGDLESPFEINWAAGGIGILPKASFARRALWTAVRRRPGLVWAAHVNLLPLARVAARLARAVSVLDVYGLEVWSRHRPAVARALRTAPHVVSDCHNTADYLRGEKHWRGKTMTVAWDCVDTERFTPGAPDLEVLARYGLRAEPGKLVVLMLGRIARAAAHKGWSRLLDVAARLDGSRFRFVLAGDGDLRSELMTQVRSRQLEDRVSFTGSVHEDDLVTLYRFADAFTLVSDAGPGRGEGIPLTPLEAAACGVPIVVGNQDGSREAVIEGENGFIIDPMDLDGHVDRLCRFLDPERRSAMGSAARRRIEAHHSFEVFVDVHRQILSRVVS